MKVGILCAGDREAAPFFSMLDGDRVRERAMLRIHEGKMAGVETAVLYSGVCKVNAAIAAQILIGACGCGAVISAGTAGGMDEGLRVFDTAVCTECAYHDVAEGILTGFHPWMESVWFRSDERLLDCAHKALEDRQDVHFGRMVTGEQFIEDDRREEINRRFSPLTVDMESAAIAHVCFVNRIPFLAVRTITDTAETVGRNAFEMNCSRAAEISAEAVRRILAEMAADKR